MNILTIARFSGPIGPSEALGPHSAMTSAKTDARREARKSQEKTKGFGKPSEPPDTTVYLSRDRSGAGEHRSYRHGRTALSQAICAETAGVAWIFETWNATGRSRRRSLPRSKARRLNSSPKLMPRPWSSTGAARPNNFFRSPSMLGWRPSKLSLRRKVARHLRRGGLNVI